MFVVDAGYILDTPGSGEIRPSTWSGGISPIGAFRGAMPGAPTIGDHGPDYQFEPAAPAKHEAILNCGCTLMFPMPTMDGEMLWCDRHDDWYKSRPAVVRKRPDYSLKCATEGCDWSKELSSGPAYTYAKKHAFGKSGHRRNAPHAVLMGKHTPSGIVWKRYEEKK